MLGILACRMLERLDCAVPLGGPLDDVGQIMMVISEPPHQLPFESTIRPASDIMPQYPSQIRVQRSAEVDVVIPLTQR